MKGDMPIKSNIGGSTNITNTFVRLFSLLRNLKNIKDVK